MRYFKKGWIKGGVSDGWGLSAEFYPCEQSLSIMFIHWYIIIEKDYDELSNM
jgi:hypothetical protein